MFWSFPIFFQYFWFVVCLISDTSVFVIIVIAFDFVWSIFSELEKVRACSFRFLRDRRRDGYQFCRLRYLASERLMMFIYLYGRIPALSSNLLFKRFFGLHLAICSNISFNLGLFSLPCFLLLCLKLSHMLLIRLFHASYWLFHGVSRGQTRLSFLELMPGPFRYFFSLACEQVTIFNDLFLPFLMANLRLFFILSDQLCKSAKGSDITVVLHLRALSHSRVVVLLAVWTD